MIFENDNQASTRTTPDRRSRISNPTPYSGLGKLPPQATDLEEAILGALMLEKDSLFQINDFLEIEHFYRDNHQKVFSAIKNLFQKGEPTDILKVTAQLRQQGELEMIGGAYYITELTNRVASAANIEYHARIVYQKFLQRDLIRICSDVINSAYEDTTDVLELIEHNQMALMRLSNFQTSQQSERIDTMIDAGLRELEKPVVAGLTGVGTGFSCLNDFTAGWQKGEVTILAARPAMGKTALAIQLARNAAVLYDVPTAVFSLEMTKSQLTKRMISNETEVFLNKINKKTLDEYDKQSLSGKLYALRNAPLHVDDTPALTTVAFRTKCIRLKKLFNIQFIVVDYLQLMRGVSAEGKNKGNREQEIGEITRCLKSVAKELDVPVLALSQLSRATESRPGASKRPMLQDLRESGNIEQDADNVLFLFRPEYYGLTADSDGNSTESLAELIWAKHRMGEIGTLYLKFRGAVMRFENWVAAATSPYNQPQLSAEEQLKVVKPDTIFRQAGLGFPEHNTNQLPDDEIPF